MNTSPAHLNASVEEWCRSLEDFSVESIAPLEVTIASIDIHQMDDVLENEEEGTRLPPKARLPALEKHESNLAVLLRDDTNWLPRLRSLQETDVILLLAPLVIPTEPGRRGDPFETLGRALAQEDQTKTPPVARNKVRHAPYRREQGITSQHLSFIKHSNFIILCYVTEPGQEIPLDVADITFAVIEHRPCVIVVCCNPIDPDQYIPFPTVVQTDGYSAEALQATAELILGKNTIPIAVESAPAQYDPHVWKVDDFNDARDISESYQLWKTCVDSQFALDQQTFMQLLDRPGYAKHYIVRDTQSGHILGFCATFFHFVDRDGEKLVASVACILTHPQHRRRGIGVSLHAHAVAQLKRTRGVVRLQLGSTYPRLLYGPSFHNSANEHLTWIRRRGWQIGENPIRDLILDLRDWSTPTTPPATSNITFRSCMPEEMVEVIDLVDKTATRLGRTGWFDQYASLMNTSNVRDVIVAIENNVIVATGLTFTPGCGSQIASNVPWPAQIGDDVGGVTCVCVHEKSTDSVTIGLLDACVQKLRAQGMEKVFMDGIRDGFEELSELGFREWARYREVWKDT